jgi:serine/threonine protein kinase
MSQVEQPPEPMSLDIASRALKTPSDLNDCSFSFSNDLTEDSFPGDNDQTFRFDLDRLGYANDTIILLSDLKDISPFTEGSNAILYKATLGSQAVIVKIVKSAVAQDRVALNEFETEIKILRHVQHPHIVKYLGRGMHPRPFFVMEYLDGGTIWTANCTVPNIRDALKYAKQLAFAMNYLHTELADGVVVIHRDLKPDNIGLSKGVVKVLDFGLSTTVHQTESLSEVYEMTGMTGSLRYMAPEVALSKPYSEKVDVYSFGIILWQLLTGKAPFARCNRGDIMDSVVKRHYRPPLCYDWPQALRSLIEDCWSPIPERRPSFSIIIAYLDKLG